MGNPQAGCVTWCQQFGRREIHIASAREPDTARQQEGCAGCEILAEKMFSSRTGNRAAGSCKRRVGAEDRRTRRRAWSRKTSAKLRLEDLSRSPPIRHLLETLHTVLLEGAVHRRQQITIEENAKSRPKRPVGRRAVRQPNSGREVVCVLPELRGQVFEVIANPRINGEARCWSPVPLKKPGVPRGRKIRVGTTERLPVLVWVSLQE